MASSEVERAGQRRVRLHQTIAAGIATLGGFLFGYDTGVISGALPAIKQDLHLTATSQGLTVSSLLIGAAFGATFGGRLADLIGRKDTIRYAAVIFVVATLGSAAAPSATLLVLVRVLLGLAVGCVSATVPVYIGEIAPADRRGRMVNQNELMVVTGQLIAFVVNAIVIHLVAGHASWRWMLGLAAIPAIVLLVGTWLIPETPRWSALHGRYRQAEHALRRLRRPPEVARDLELMREHAKRPHIREGRSGWTYLRARWIRVLVGIGIGVGVCQQISGINTIVYYAPTILESTGLATASSLTASIAVGAMGVLGVSLGMYLVGRVDRRPMLTTGLVGTTSALLLLGLAFLLPETLGRSIGILALMVVFVGFQQSCVSTVTWLILSEMFPLKIRGFVMGLAVFVLWIGNFAVSMVFPILTGRFGPTWAFLVFVALGVLAILFVTRYVPETRRHSLEELEQHFRAQYSR